MLPDPTSLPFTGSALAFGLLYAGVSLFITGPLVGERTIAKSGWADSCEIAVVRGAETGNPLLDDILPGLDCDSLFAPWFGEEGAQFCQRHGGEFALPFVEQFQQNQRRREEKRLSRTTDGAASRCSCAISYTLESERIPLAIHAGTLRLVTPHSIKNLSGELGAALNTSQCAMKE
jgi:hypothetical protein